MLTPSEIHAILNKPTYIKPPKAIVDLILTFNCEAKLYDPILTAKLYCYACEQSHVSRTDNLRLSMRKLAELMHVTPRKISVCLQVLEDHELLVTDKSNPTYAYRVKDSFYRSNLRESL